MNGYEYILTKQTEWAQRRDLTLIGSKGARGRPAYTTRLDDNLFQPLLPSVRADFAAGDGAELGAPGSPGKMQAVHSSSALAVNVFQYWKSISAPPVIAAVCRLCRSGSQVAGDIRFEEKYPVSDSFHRHPNIDVVFHNRPGSTIQRLAVECKFAEAYGGRKHAGLKPAYLTLSDAWEGLPNLRRLAESISPTDDIYRHLHPAQLVKHILGLRRACGHAGFRLLYLWYDVLGEEGARHQDEVRSFSEMAKMDGVRFHSLTYQELMANMVRWLRPEHEGYVSYLTGRYL
jgi:hypothetical protein